MPSYTAPVKDLQFVLHEVLKASASDISGYSELEPDYKGAEVQAAGNQSLVVISYAVFCLKKSELICAH